MKKYTKFWTEKVLLLPNNNRFCSRVFHPDQNMLQKRRTRWTYILSFTSHWYVLRIHNKILDDNFNGGEHFIRIFDLANSNIKVHIRTPTYKFVFHPLKALNSKRYQMRAVFVRSNALLQTKEYINCLRWKKMCKFWLMKKIVECFNRRVGEESHHHYWVFGKWSFDSAIFSCWENN